MASRTSYVPETAPEILLVCPEQSDYDSLCNILSPCKCHLHCARSCQETAALLRKEPVGVVISNTELPDGTWKDLLNQSSQLSGAPNLIVMSRLADERLWADVLNRGGYDLLPMPCEAAEVVRIITQAWTDWKRKRAVMAQNNPAVGDSSVSYSEKMILAKGWRESAIDIPAGDKGQLQKDPLDLKSTTSSK